MVVGLKQMGSIVAVTANGTNDCPAMSKADVALAMAKNSTDLCNKAADILITDDNFVTVVLARFLGINLRENVQRYLSYRLTVSICVCLITIIGSVVCKESPLTPIELLSILCISDVLAMIALATEKPQTNLLQNQSQNLDDYIVSRKMMKHIIGQVIWQCIVIFTLTFAGEYMIPESDSRHEWPQKPGYVHPGRASDYISSDVYSVEMANELGQSRHMTFVFTVFIFM